MSGDGEINLTAGRAMLRGLLLAGAVLVLTGGLSDAVAVEIQGHRGARGLAPENTLAGFEMALGVGVHVLELDVGMSADGVPVISHDRRIKADLARRDGVWLSEDGPALMELTYAQIRLLDVGRIRPGTRYAERFAGQAGRDGEPIPRLADLFDMVLRAGADQIRFNIEIKTSPLAPEETFPAARIADAVVELVRNNGLAGRVSIQSSDWATLVHVQRTAPAIATAYLTASQRWLDNLERGKSGPSPWTAGYDLDQFGSGPVAVPRAVAAAGGAIWSPYFKEVSAEALAEARSLGLKVVVWTVNAAPDMARMADLGVDGIISDVPDALRRVLADRGLALPEPVRVAR